MLNAPPADTIFSSFDLTRRPAVIAAVSGGSDSLAMLLLLRQWLERRAPHVRLVAVTVDHGLRSESAGEAAAVSAFSAARGIEHHVMHWQGEKPRAGLAEAARQARYRLLCQAARDAGADIIVTGHTADDQAETVLMRSRRGDGLGLAGMAPATLLDGDVWLLRPLLGCGRAALRALLVQGGVDWIDDPTNADRRFERARVRLELAAEGGAGRLLEIAGTAAARRQSLAGRAGALVEATVRQVQPGLLHADPAFSRFADGEAAGHALRALLAVAGGTAFLPDASRTAGLLERLAAPGFRGTLSRALVAARRDGLWLARETRGLPPPTVMHAGEVWDGRYRILELADGRMIGAAAVADDVPSSRWVGQSHMRSGFPRFVTLRVPALPPPEGEEGARMGEFAPFLSPVDRGKGGARSATEWGSITPPAGLLRAASAARLVSWTVAGEATPMLPQASAAKPVLGPYHRLLPSFDLPLARALANVIGAGEILGPPFAGHNG